MITTITQTIIRGLILCRADIIFSTNNTTINKNQSTNTQELIVHIISRNLLFHWYIKVQTTIIERIKAIIIGINFELFQKITKNLHIT